MLFLFNQPDIVIIKIVKYIKHYQTIYFHSVIYETIKPYIFWGKSWFDDLYMVPHFFTAGWRMLIFWTELTRHACFPTKCSWVAPLLQEVHDGGLYPILWRFTSSFRVHQIIQSPNISCRSSIHLPEISQEILRHDTLMTLWNHQPPSDPPIDPLIAMAPPPRFQRSSKSLVKLRQQGITE